MKINKQVSITLLIGLFCYICEAQKIPSGIKTLQSQLISVAVLLGPIAFICSGIYYLVDKQRGNEKASGALIGTFFISGATSIFTLIYNAFN